MFAIERHFIITNFPERVGIKYYIDCESKWKWKRSRCYECKYMLHKTVSEYG